MSGPTQGGRCLTAQLQLLRGEAEPARKLPRELLEGWFTMWHADGERRQRMNQSWYKVLGSFRDADEAGQQLIFCNTFDAKTSFFESPAYISTQKSITKLPETSPSKMTFQAS